MDWQAPGTHTREHIGTTEDQTCPNCESADLLSDSSIGLVCTNCSTVLDQDFIVNSSEFTKQSDGSSKLNGQIVGTGSDFNAGVNGIFISNPNSSRQQTIARNTTYMYELADLLKLGDSAEDIVEASVRMFTLLQQRGFLKGRQSKIVAAMCLYTNCRLEKVPRTLTDIVEVTRVNQFDLGKYYSQIKTLLRLQIPPMTAQMLVGRYVAELDFGDKQSDVARVAEIATIRLKKDYIDAGRRPEGICGVAIILAARMHGFSRSIDEIIEVLKVSKATVTQRLKEFENTASSNLKAKDFLTLELPEEEKPPVLLLQDREKQARLEDALPIPVITNSVYDELEKEMHALLERTKSFSEKELKQLASQPPLEDELDDEINFEGEIDKEETDADIVVKDLALVEVPPATTEVEIADDNFSNFSDDDEVNNALLTEEQSKVKAAIWHSVNKEYIEKQKHRKVSSPAKKPRKMISFEPQEFETTAESAAHAMYKSLKDEKKGSSKLNYESCKALFNVQVPNF